jgi:hypothetical protein
VITSVLLIALPVCFGNWTANALVTERILQITFFCVLLIWQNPANMLNTNYLSFIYSFLLSLAFLLLMHAARHTFATTTTLAKGVPIETVSKMLGHTNIETTQIYARITNNKISNDMQGLDKKFVGIEKIYKEVSMK